MNILIKVIFSIFYYLLPSLRQEDNSTTIERVFRGNPFIHPFLDFFITGEVCVRKCMLYRLEDMVIRQCQVWKICWMREDFSFKLYKEFMLHALKNLLHAFRNMHYHATK